MSQPDITVRKDGKMQVITFNRPKKKNAINAEMYKVISDCLKSSELDDDIAMTVITGTGEYYSSGNDFVSFDGQNYEDETEGIRARLDKLRVFMKSLIEYPKILVAVVNGPAIGIAATTLALFDVIYATDNATFHTPFSSLGMSAEGCSSFTFPLAMGKSLSAEMLYFNKKITAQEAKKCGFVSQVFPEKELSSVFEMLKSYSNLPLNSMMATKRLIRKSNMKNLLYANDAELDELFGRFQSEEFINALMQTFLSKRNKL